MFATLVVAQTHACGIEKAGRSVVCWGDPEEGKLDTPPGSFASIAASDFFTCGVKTDGGAACWGKNALGTLAPPPALTTTSTEIPVGYNFACVLKTHGAVIRWGSATDGQTQPDEGSCTAIDAHGDGLFACGVRRDTSIAYWGWDGIYDGNRDTAVPDTAVPDTEANPNTGCRAVAVSAGDTCGLKNDGTVVCWGGFTPTTHAPNPGNDTAKGFTAISAGGGKYCGLKKDRSLFCWGNRSDVPDTKFIVVSAQGGYICGVQTDNQVSCLTTIMGVEAPEELVLPEDENSDFIDADFHIGSGVSYACGVETSGQVSCWGISGQNEYKPLPTDNSGFVRVSTGEVIPCGVKEDESAVCWGPNVIGTDSRYHPPPELR